VVNNLDTDKLNRLFNKLFDIRQGEEQKALLMFIYIFFIIASLLILKSLRDSLLLTRFGISKLPYAFVLTAVFATILITIYSLFAKKIQFNKLILYTTFFWIACLILIWVMLFYDYRARWFFFTFYVWVALFGALATSQFWLLANYVFNSREAKRLFGFIGAGGIAGGIFGGYLTNFLVRFIGTSNMIFFCIGFLSLCTLILTQVWEKTARFSYAEKLAQEKRVAKTYGDESGFKSILKSRHLSLLAGIVCVGVIVATFVHYQFSAMATKHIETEDQLMAFFGFWLSNLGIASLIIQLFLTRRIMKVLGVIASLFFLPLGIFIGSIGILMHPALWSAIVMKVSDGGFKQSINRSGIELLILPIPSGVKNKSKTFIDVAIDSLATGMGGLLLIVLAGQLGLSQQYLSLIVIGFIVLWAVFILRIKSEYKNAFRVALEKRSIDLNEQTLNFEDASVIESFIRVLEGSNEKQILYVLKLIEDVRNERLIPSYQKLIRHESPHIKIQVLKNMTPYSTIDFTHDVQSLIEDSEFEVKVAALRYLFKRVSNREATLNEILKHKDYQVRIAALLCAAHEINEDGNLKKELHFSQIFNQFTETCDLTRTDSSETESTKINLAKIIGIAGDPKLYSFLTNLFNDSSIKVVESAIISAGRTADPIFIPSLMHHLDTKLIRSVTRESLAKYGNDILESLDSFLSNIEEDRQVRLQIPKVLSHIGTQESVNLLLKHTDQKDLFLRFRVIKALSKLRNTFPSLKFDKHHIENTIVQEIQKYFQTLSFLTTLTHSHALEERLWATQKNSDRVQKIWQLLLKALEERLSENLEIVFILLGLEHTPTDMYNTYRAIISENVTLQANALEYLDNTLGGQIKRKVIEIVEHATQKQSDDHFQEIGETPVESEEHVFQALLKEDAYWIKVCVLFLYAESRLSIPKEIIQTFTEHPDFKVSEVAEYALQRLESE